MLNDLASVALRVKQQVVDGGAIVRLDAEASRQRALRVKVNGENAATVLGERRRQVDRGGRLADATLLVAQRNNARGAMAVKLRRDIESAIRTTCRSDGLVVALCAACALVFRHG